MARIFVNDFTVAKTKSCACFQDHMVQQHGLGARPYDCPKCTLKFFFRTELDHHVLIFHHSDENISPSEEATTREVKNREAEEGNQDVGVTVKKEVIQEGEEEEDEEEEVNVDDQVGQEKDGKAEAEKQELKMEVDSETASCKES